jgi:hypothetical protein
MFKKIVVIILSNEIHILLSSVITTSTAQERAGHDKILEWKYYCKTTLTH